MYRPVGPRRASSAGVLSINGSGSTLRVTPLFWRPEWERQFGLASFFVCLVLALSSICQAGEPIEVRAARSVHLSYPAPEGILFYTEVVVEKSVNGSYFMACGWNTGYFGIQQLGGVEDKVVLFSVWDPVAGDNPNATAREDRVEVAYQAPDVRIKRFGGEGTGGQCFWHYNWRIGETNRFLVSAQVEGQKTQYTAWFFTQTAWKKLASFRTRTGGKLLTGYYSFIEDFRRDGQSAREERRARFINGWIKTSAGQGLGLNRARFTASSAEWESKENIDAGMEQGGFYLATGGDVKRSRELRSMIDLPSVGPALSQNPGFLPQEDQK